MLKYELKKMFTWRKTLGIFVLTIVSVVMMLNNLSSETNFSIEGALDTFLYTNNGYNMLLLFILMMISIPVFSMEEKNNMSSVISASSKGRIRVPVIKMLSVLFITEIYVVIYGVTNIIGYKNSFGKFGDITTGINEFADACMQNNPEIRSAQDILMILVISFALYSNFVVLFTMYLSIKHIKPVNIYVFMFISYFVFLCMGEVPRVGTFFGLLLARPFSTEDAYIVLCNIGSAPVTLKNISYIIYLIAIGGLAIKIRNAYQPE